MTLPTGHPDEPLPPLRQRHPLSPERVRTTEFSRTPLGRRGYNEDEVRMFLARVAEDLAAADAEKAGLRGEVKRLRNYYREHGVDVDGRRGDHGTGAAGSGVGAVGGMGAAAGAGGTGIVASPSVAAINLMSQAQQAADAQVAQAEEYCRRLVLQAREQHEDIMREAAQRANEAAARVAAAYNAGDDTGGAGGFEREVLEQRIAWLRTFAEVTQVQLRSVFEALTREVDKLGDLPDPTASATASQPGPPGSLAASHPPASAAPVVRQ